MFKDNNPQTGGSMYIEDSRSGEQKENLGYAAFECVVVAVICILLTSLYYKIHQAPTYKNASLPVAITQDSHVAFVTVREGTLSIRRMESTSSFSLAFSAARSDLRDSVNVRASNYFREEFVPIGNEPVDVPTAQIVPGIYGAYTEFRFKSDTVACRLLTVFDPQSQGIVVSCDDQNKTPK